MEHLEDIAGEYVARAFCSKNWQLRDAAVAWLGNQAREGALTSKDAKDVFRCLSRIVQVRKEVGMDERGGRGRGETDVSRFVSCIVQVRKGGWVGGTVRGM